MVLSSSYWVMKSASEVEIDIEALEKFADEYSHERVQNLRKEVEWDSCDWHYSDTSSDLTAQYIFVMDSLNYCFWPVPGFEYEQLATSLRDVLKADPTAFNADKLQAITPTELQAWFPTHELPHIRGRVDRLRELGSVLARDYDGSASNMVRAADHSAVALVRLVIEKLQGFRDTVVYRGALTHFYKRAQILTSDLWAAYGRKVPPKNDTDKNDEDKGTEVHFAAFHDMEKLTMFADYRVPQILRDMGVLKYSAELGARIDAREEIPFGSESETNLRAATVVAVDFIARAINKRGVHILPVEVDWLLWNAGETNLASLAPQHRTLTLYY